MTLKNLTEENFIELCKLRLKHKGQDFTEIKIDDDSFNYFYGVSFIISSEKYDDYLFPISFEMFYPDEFIYLLDLGIDFKN